jgi:hypothetical protein
MNSTVTIVLWTLFAVGCVIGMAVVGWYLYTRVFFRSQYLARKIIRSKANRVPYDDLCDTFFAEDEYLGGQYAQMKANPRVPKTDVLNLCYNRARGLLGQK